MYIVYIVVFYNMYGKCNPLRQVLAAHKGRLMKLLVIYYTVVWYNAINNLCGMVWKVQPSKASSCRSQRLIDEVAGNLLHSCVVQRN